MSEDLGLVHEEVMVALYLRGLKRAAPVAARSWPHVLDALRARCLSKENVVSGLAQAGFCLESYVLQDQKLWREAEILVRGSEALTVASGSYPYRWIEMLGDSAPPALWWNGVPMPVVGDSGLMGGWRGFGIVGSRDCTRAELRWVGEVARESVRLGHVVVSGGARGCDRAAVLSALVEGKFQASQSGGDGSNRGSVTIEILPCGISSHARGWAGLISRAQSKQIRERCCQFSLEPPDAEFSVSAAKERNRLIYCLSGHTLVGAARFRIGGTWDGATQALRFRWSRILVPSESPSNVPLKLSAPGPSWNRALQALGAIVLESPRHLESALRAPETQGAFAYEIQVPSGPPCSRINPPISQSA